MVQRILKTTTSGKILEWTRNNIGFVAGVAAFVGIAICYEIKHPVAVDYTGRIRKKRREKSSVRAAVENMDGKLEEGAESIANAVISCGQGKKMLSIFQQTLPPDHFSLILEKIPSSKQCHSVRFDCDFLQQAANEEEEEQRVTFTVYTEDEDEDDDRPFSPLIDPHDFLLPEPHPHLPLYDPNHDGDPRGYLRTPGLSHSISDCNLPLAKPGPSLIGNRCVRPHSAVNVVRTVFSSHFLPRL